MTELFDIIKPNKIGIFAGGNSSESEISLKSGTAVFDVLKASGLDCEFFNVEEDSLEVLIAGIDIDVAFIALHGKLGEDGVIQRLFENRRIPYTGSGPEASALALDKITSKNKFKEIGLVVPEHILVNETDDVLTLNIEYPCVIKPRNEGSSVGVSIVSSQDSFRDSIKNAFQFGKEIMLEQFISGRELTVGILNDRALPVVEVIAANGIYDFNAKYKSNETRYLVPAELSAECTRRVKETAVKAHEILGCRHFSRVDLILSEDEKIFVLEVNTIPGLTQRSLLPLAAKEAGLDFFSLCANMLIGALGEKNSVFEQKNYAEANRRIM
ncbi:MAG: D-alanine--D-alanine ligase [Candidatus Omnitrophota bacterium]